MPSYRPRPLALRLLAAMLVAAPGLTWAQPSSPAAGKVLTLDDYDRWNRLSATSLSPSGAWLAYVVTSNAGTSSLHLRGLDRDTVVTVPGGSAPQFSPDGRWVAYQVTPPGGGGRGGRGGGAAPAPAPTGRGAATPTPGAGRRIEIRDLQSLAVASVPGATSVTFPPGSATALLRMPKAVATATHDGADLLVRTLATGETRNIGNVGLYTANAAGTLLGYTVDAAGRQGNGVYLTSLASGTTRPLDAQPADYAGLAWDTSGTRLAWLRGTTPEGKLQRENVLATASAFDAQLQPRTSGLVAGTALPAGMVISEFAPLRWGSDGRRIWLGVKAQSDAVAPADSSERANVDVWHWQDPEPQSVQVVRAAQERRSTVPAVAEIASAAVRVLGDSALRTATPTSDLATAIGRLDAPYRGEIAWGGSRADYYRIRTASGERALIARGISRTMGTSPNGEWFLYLQDGKVHAYNLRTDATVQVDAAAQRSFVDVTDDHDYERPLFGVAGWSRDGRSVLLYDRYDLWQLGLDGKSAVNLTRGTGEQQSIRFRLVSLDRQGGGGGGGRGGGGGGGGGEDPGIDLTKPLLLSAYGEWTKKSGYWEVAPGAAPRPLLWEDKAIGGIQKASAADRIILTQSTFREYPDVWVTDRSFAAPRKVTEANPFLGEYAWGSKVLVDYTNAAGQRLQATLTLPAGYEPGKQYPMIVYFYETMSQTHHNFSMPTYDDRPHISTYASNGYLVLQPDVVYEIGKPGSSALDCVLAAVDAVLARGYADPARIGLQGHSWGGYQSSFILTQTNRFAAIVTGAPPTNLTSFVGTLYRSTGTIQQGITEVGQVRMGRDRTPWNSEALYESQSPVHHADKITTPFLILHGTADGAVDWGQGLELYAAARRLGKPGILLSYPDEPHHLARRPNQKDFQIRMRQFFDHYLKGAPAPQWMTTGVPAIHKGGPPQ